ncbi:cache domain-containing sensor histidine kinase [Paenibacillus whitsoniae]|uniref:Sensor histidine kinase n=1 Tax=Paenibacillus whitsoniae TaxID=2496558 RepID=A0A430JGI8_9BACL|nr:sensor histidine kinase [Paenibacillus whitsoniae]RTE10174.1 sensor histidine kinase [Paenibacillus whitsoniae]
MKGFAQYFSGISIKNKIFSTNILIIIISISTLALFANIVSQKAIIEKAVKNSSRELVLIDNNLQTLITTVEDYSKILATDFRLQNVLYNDFLENSNLSATDHVGGLDNLSMKNTLSEVISNIVEPNTNIKAVSVLTSNHQWVDVGFADNEFASRVFGSNPEAADHSYQPVLTGLMKFKFRYEGDDDVFAVSKTVIHKDTGKTVGMVVLYVKETVIASIYERKMNYKGGNFYILDRDGKIISSQNKASLYRDFNEATSISIPYSTQEENSFFQGNGREKVLVSTHRLEPLQWSIVSVIPIDEITVERKEINQLIIRIGSLCLLLAFIVSYLLSRSITKPIFQLSRTMRDIRTGHLTARSSYQSSDEIGYLNNVFNNLMDRIEELLAENVEEQKTKAEIEFKLLQTQVQPHFLYNTLETIISLIKLNMKAEAITAAKYMADFYKISLSKGNDIISLREEIQLTASYLEIQQLRYVEYMEYSMEIDEEIMSCSISKLTLQPIVENAIYHGLKRKTEKGLLRITGRRLGEEVHIDIYDNGVGIEESQIRRMLMEVSGSKERVSFGVRSVHNRIRMLYGDRYGLEIQSELGAYTKVTIRLPFKPVREV